MLIVGVNGGNSFVAPTEPPVLSDLTFDFLVLPPSSSILLLMGSLVFSSIPPHSPDLAQATGFVCFPDAKSPQRETFWGCGRGEKQDSAEALEAPNGREGSLGALPQKESSSQVTDRRLNV